MLHIIANPAAQSGSGKKITRQLLRACRKNHIPAARHLTTHPGHAGKLAAALRPEPDDLLLIIGGDGSINEVINGFHHAPACPVLLLPAGSGNDFARGLGMCRSIDDILELILDESCHGAPSILDLGEVSVELPRKPQDAEPLKKKFAVSCGLGMDAAVCLSISKSPMKRILNRLHMGKLTYLIIGIQELCRTTRERRANICLVTDYDKVHIHENTAFISIHNTPYEGGGFPFAPQASPQDGLLTVCVVCVRHRIELVPVLLSSLIGGRHVLFRKNVHIYNCRQIEIESDRPLTFHSDGEPLPDISHIEAEVLPGFLPLLYRGKH